MRTKYLKAEVESVGNTVGDDEMVWVHLVLQAGAVFVDFVNSGDSFLLLRNRLWVMMDHVCAENIKGKIQCSANLFPSCKIQSANADRICALPAPAPYCTYARSHRRERLLMQCRFVGLLQPWFHEGWTFRKKKHTGDTRTCKACRSSVSKGSPST